MQTATPRSERNKRAYNQGTFASFVPGKLCLMNPYPASPADIPSRPASRRPLWRRTVFWAFLAMLAILAVQRFPAEVSYWYLASAEIAAEQGDIEKAVRLTEQALRWAPNDSLAHETRANVLLLANRPEEALVSIDEALRGNPGPQTRLVLLYQRSLIHKEEGRFEQALSDLDAAAELAPRLRPSFERAELLIALQRKEEAAREVEDAAKSPRPWLLSNPVELDNSIAYFSGLLGINLDEALRRAESAVQATEGKASGVLDTRGYVYYRLKQYDKALADLNEAIRLADQEYEASRKGALDLRSKKLFARTNAVLHYHRALVLEALNKPDEAERDLARVRELGFEPGEQLF